MNRFKNYIYLSLVLVFASPALLQAQEKAQSVESTGSDDNMYINMFLVAVAALLIPVIGILGKTLLLTINANARKNKNGKLKSLALIFAFSFGINGLLANSTTIAETSVLPTAGDLLPYMLVGAILFETMIILMLLSMINKVLAKNEVVKEEKHLESNQVKGPSKWIKIWEKINKLQPIEREADLDTGHSYDGIRELDNATPPWFIAGFILSILTAFIYMWVYHVSESAPLQIEEYTISVAKAEADEAAYLKLQANNVDENTVKMMDEAGIAAGAELYKMGPNCAVCHKADGGGQVGPNLTDNHSIYGNSLSEIFKSIKYGRANGMTSWKDKFTATQIGQIASYVKSLENTNVEGGKEPQGEIFELEEAVGSKTDSTALDL